MQTLKLDNKWFPKIADGTKASTILMGRQDVPLDKLKFVSEDYLWQATVAVDMVTYTFLGNIPAEVAMGDGFKNRLEFISAMKLEHPDCVDSSEVTLVCFSPFIPLIGAN